MLWVLKSNLFSQSKLNILLLLFSLINACQLLYIHSKIWFDIFFENRKVLHTSMAFFFSIIHFLRSFDTIHAHFTCHINFHIPKKWIEWALTPILNQKKTKPVSTNPSVSYMHRHIGVHSTIWNASNGIVKFWSDCCVPFYNLYRFVDRFVISLRLKRWVVYVNNINGEKSQFERVRELKTETKYTTGKHNMALLGTWRWYWVYKYDPRSCYKEKKTRKKPTHKLMWIEIWYLF